MWHIALSMGLNDTYEHGIVRGVVRYAREQQGWHLYGAGWMFRGLGNILTWNGDGIIARIESAEQAHLLGTAGLPIVDVAGAYPSEAFAAVTNDDRATGKAAAAHFLAAGFSAFAFCGVARVAWSRARLDGFRDAVQERLPVFEESLPWWERPEEFGELAGWLEAMSKPVALFAANDTAGIKVTALCSRLGIAVPDDVAVLGVDNEDILCELSDPPLSSVPLDCERIGYRAAATLHALIERAGGPDTSTVVRPLPVIERASTQTVHSEDPVVRRASRYIRAHVGEGLRVPHIAAASGVSRRSLELRFRAGTGRSVHDEIVRQRMRNATALLRNTDLPVRAVSEACGIASVQRFYELFRRSEGCTPSEYRRTRRG